MLSEFRCNFSFTLQKARQKPKLHKVMFLTLVALSTTNKVKQHSCNRTQLALSTEL